ncbi:hypothetical protein Tco_0792767 [Tanacetum coccineum]
MLKSLNSKPGDLATKFISIDGKLPVKYLGVPLISSRILNKDCKILVEKVKNRIGDWKNKSLSFAGRLQLCKSIISSMHVYWASVFVIPKGIIHDIQQLIRYFLWCNGEFKRGKDKVKIRNGFNTPVWYDHWCDQCPLIRFFMPRDITLESFNLQNKVVDFVSNGLWSWPQSWLLKAPNLEQMMVPTFDTSSPDLS